MLTARRAASYLMDQGEFDNSPVLETAQYTPVAQNQGQGGLFVQQLSTTDNPDGAANQGGSNTQPGAGIQMTPAEKEMREGDGSSAASQEQQPHPPSAQPKTSPAPRSSYEFYPDGSVRFWDDVHLRWKELPSIANGIIGGLVTSGLPGLGAQLVGGALGGAYLDKTKFGFPWFSYEPEKPQELQQPTPPKDLPQQPPKEVDPNEGLC